MKSLWITMSSEFYNIFVCFQHVVNDLMTFPITIESLCSRLKNLMFYIEIENLWKFYHQIYWWKILNNISLLGDMKLSKMGFSKNTFIWKWPQKNHLELLLTLWFDLPCLKLQNEASLSKKFSSLLWYWFFTTSMVEVIIICNANAEFWLVTSL